MAGPDWVEKPLWTLTVAEWEALCDGCGRCCLHKLEDEDSGELYFSRVACRLLDVRHCRCRDYSSRTKKVPECRDLRLEPEAFAWLPPSCAYRRRAEGLPLADWHPALTQDPASVHRAGISVRDWAIPEHPGLSPEDHLLPRAWGGLSEASDPTSSA